MTLKKEELIFVVLVLFVLNMNTWRVSAEITLHENSSNIETSYVENDFVKGRINVSINKEENNQFTSNFRGGINLYDLLKNLSLSYTCDPENCKDTYSASNGATEKNINILNKKIVGFLFNGNIQSIDTFIFNLSDAGGGQQSCENQINLDLFNDGSIDFMNVLPSGDVCASRPKGDGCFEDDENKTLANI